METLLNLLNVDTTFFTILSYPISYIEFVGTILNILTVWLLTKKNILNWPIGIMAVSLFGILFYQLNLYADLFEQVYYFITGIIGWYAWSKAKKPTDAEERIVVRRNSAKQNLLWLGGIVAGTAVGAWAMANLHLWLPGLFPEPASLPLLDTLTTVMSFAAQALLIMRILENWLLWIIVDVIAIGLYWHKGVPFVALLYAIFLVLATRGFFTWRQTYKEEQLDEKSTGHRQVLPAA